MGDWYNSEPQPDRPVHFDIYNSEGLGPTDYGRRDDQLRGKETEEYQRYQANMYATSTQSRQADDYTRFYKNDPELRGAPSYTHARIKDWKDRGYYRARRDLNNQFAVAKG